MTEMMTTLSLQIVGVVEPIIQHADWFFPGGGLRFLTLCCWLESTVSKKNNMKQIKSQYIKMTEAKGLTHKLKLQEAWMEMSPLVTFRALAFVRWLWGWCWVRLAPPEGQCARSVRSVGVGREFGLELGLGEFGLRL